MKYIINSNIWYSDSAIYFMNTDNKLLKISGEDFFKVKEVVNFLLSNPENINTFSSPNLSKEEFNELISFLVQHNLIDTDTKIEAYRNIAIIGNQTISNYLKNGLSQYKVCVNLEQDDWEGIDLIVILAPIYSNYEKIEKIGRDSYEKNINLLYSEITPSAFTIGPIITPKLHTASLNCYLKRRRSNVNSQKLFSEFINSEKDAVSELDLSQYPYFKTSMEHLMEIIRQYMDHQGFASQHLTETSITFNYITCSVERATVLKDSFSKLFVKSTYAPFNG